MDTLKSSNIERTACKEVNADRAGSLTVEPPPGSSLHFYCFRPHHFHKLGSIRVEVRPMYFVAALLFLALPQFAHAEIYKFVDENGLVTYTNMPRPGSKPQMVIPDINRPEAVPADSGKKAKSSGRIPTPSSFPRVDTGTQSKRDDMRRQLLVEEMRSEERNLAASRSELVVNGRRPGADINKLAEAVRMHEKNIEMLKKELSHIR